MKFLVALELVNGWVNHESVLLQPAVGSHPDRPMSWRSSPDYLPRPEPVFCKQWAQHFAGPATCSLRKCRWFSAGKRIKSIGFRAEFVDEVIQCGRPGGKASGFREIRHQWSRIFVSGTSLDRPRPCRTRFWARSRRGGCAEALMAVIRWFPLYLNLMSKRLATALKSGSKRVKPRPGRLVTGSWANPRSVPRIQ